jgi:hypothetical protein
MLLPVLAKSKAQAKSIACKNHLHEMAIALEMYAEDTKSYPFYMQGGVSGGWTHWPDMLFPYYKIAWDNPAYHCPTYNGAISKLPADEGLFGSYAYNVNGTQEITGTGYQYLRLGLGLGASGNNQPLEPEAEAAVVSASQMFAMMDAPLQVMNQAQVKSMLSAGTNYYVIVGPGLSGLDYAKPSGYLSSDLLAPDLYLYNTAQPPHGKWINVVCCDGHVMSVAPTNMINLPKTARNWNADNQLHEETWLY